MASTRHWPWAARRRRLQGRWGRARGTTTTAPCNTGRRRTPDQTQGSEEARDDRRSPTPLPAARRSGFRARAARRPMQTPAASCRRRDGSVINQSRILDGLPVKSHGNIAATQAPRITHQYVVRAKNGDRRAVRGRRAAARAARGEQQLFSGCGREQRALPAMPGRAPRRLVVAGAGSRVGAMPLAGGGERHPGPCGGPGRLGGPGLVPWTAESTQRLPGEVEEDVLEGAAPDGRGPAGMTSLGGAPGGDGREQPRVDRARRRRTRRAPARCDRTSRRQRGAQASPGRGRGRAVNRSVVGAVRRSARRACPAATTRPRSTTTTWSASRSASSMRWVVSTTATPLGAQLADQLPDASRACGSSPARRLVQEDAPRGGRRRRSASASRCCWPPESRADGRAARSREAQPLGERVGVERVRVQRGDVAQQLERRGRRWAAPPACSITPTRGRRRRRRRSPGRGRARGRCPPSRAPEPLAALDRGGLAGAVGAEHRGDRARGGRRGRGRRRPCGRRTRLTRPCTTSTAAGVGGMARSLGRRSGGPRRGPERASGSVTRVVSGGLERATRISAQWCCGISRRAPAVRSRRCGVDVGTAAAERPTPATAWPAPCSSDGPVTAADARRAARPDPGRRPPPPRRSLVADGLVSRASRRPYGRAAAGAGRPGRTCSPTPAHASMTTAYDDLAACAHGVPGRAARAGARSRPSPAAGSPDLERRYAPVVDAAGDDADARAQALAARAGRATGTPRSARPAAAAPARPPTSACSCARVTARCSTSPREFPQLCEAETEVFSRLLGVHVQRLATLAHGDARLHHAHPARRPSRPSPRTTAQHLTPDRCTPTEGPSMTTTPTTARDRSSPRPPSARSRVSARYEYGWADSDAAGATASAASPRTSSATSRRSRTSPSGCSSCA